MTEGNDREIVHAERIENPKDRARRKPFLPAFLSVLALLVAAGSATSTYLLWRKLKPAIDAVGWAQLVNEDSSTANRITAQVGTIQFLKNQFSVQLESVRYDANGVVLEGFVGNPTNLVVSNLTLEFHVKQPVYSLHDKFVSSPLNSFERQFLWLDDVGSGQTTPISVLPPGARQKFEVSIPNVKQDKNGIDLRVVFTGERYSYKANDQ